MSKEIEVNDYVRTDNGIDKVIKTGIDKFANKKWIETEHDFMLETDVRKSSKNIRELIEEGDYVNGHEVVTIKDNKIYIDSVDYAKIEDYETDEYGREIGYSIVPIEFEGKIESILTYEQFLANEYKVEV